MIKLIISIILFFIVIYSFAQGFEPLNGGNPVESGSIKNPAVYTIENTIYFFYIKDSVLQCKVASDAQSPFYEQTIDIKGRSFTGYRDLKLFNGFSQHGWLVFFIAEENGEEGNRFQDFIFFS